MTKLLLAFWLPVIVAGALGGDGGTQVFAGLLGIVGYLMWRLRRWQPSQPLSARF